MGTSPNHGFRWCSKMTKKLPRNGTNLKKCVCVNSKKTWWTPNIGSLKAMNSHHWMGLQQLKKCLAIGAGPLLHQRSLNWKSIPSAGTACLPTAGQHLSELSKIFRVLWGGWLWKNGRTHRKIYKHTNLKIKSSMFCHVFVTNDVY